MNGFQRFALLILCILAVLVCFPDYHTGATWGFMGIMLAVWTGVIMILAVVLGVFGLDRFDVVNRLVNIVLLGGILYSLLAYMPQTDNVVPLAKLKQGYRPSADTLKQGIKHLTFNFDFVHRNVRSENNFVNQQDPNAKRAPKQTKQEKPKEPRELEILDIQVEEDE